jgi:hypothetical protein
MHSRMKMILQVVACVCLAMRTCPPVFVLQKGDSMMVREAPEDPGWFEGEMNGMRGLVPGTHVVKSKP